MFQILRLHPIRLLLLLLATWKFPFAIADGTLVTGLLVVLGKAAAKI
jgi:hypothetical protein